MPSKRQLRVAEQIHEVLSELLMFEVRDPRLSDVTVMEVNIDRELMYVDVYVSALSGEEAREETLEALASASGFLRRELGKRIRIQHTPELRFSWDEVLARADRIENLLNSLDIPPDDGETEVKDEHTE